MMDLQKKFKMMVVVVLVLMTTIFVLKLGPVKIDFLQQFKLTNNSVQGAKKPITTPNQARNFLNDLDMPTRDYESVETPGYYGDYEADSDKLILETREPNRFLNNISYSVFGDKNVAEAVELDLNVNDMSFSANSLAEFIKYSDYLMYKATGQNLTPDMKKSMQKKNEGEWIVDDYKIKLKAEIFPGEEIIKGMDPTSDPGAFALTFLIEL